MNWGFVVNQILPTCVGSWFGRRSDPWYRVCCLPAGLCYILIRLEFPVNLLLVSLAICWLFTSILGFGYWLIWKHCKTALTLNNSTGMITYGENLVCRIDEIVSTEVREIDADRTTYYELILHLTSGNLLQLPAAFRTYTMKNRFN